MRKIAKPYKKHQNYKNNIKIKIESTVTKNKNLFKFFLIASAWLLLCGDREIKCHVIKSSDMCQQCNNVILQILLF